MITELSDGISWTSDKNDSFTLTHFKIFRLSYFFLKNYSERSLRNWVDGVSKKKTFNFFVFIYDFTSKGGAFFFGSKRCLWPPPRKICDNFLPIFWQKNYHIFYDLKFYSPWGGQSHLLLLEKKPHLWMWNHLCAKRAVLIIRPNIFQLFSVESAKILKIVRKSKEKLTRSPK